MGSHRPVSEKSKSVRFFEPGAGQLDVVDPFFAIRAVPRGQRQLRVFAPQRQAEPGAGPFLRVEVAAIDGLEAEQARAFFGFVGERPQQSIISIINLGGWTGYRRSSPPGPIRMKRGMERFRGRFVGWQLARMSYTTGGQKVKKKLCT